MKELSKDRIVFLISHRLYLFPEFDQVIWMDQKMGTCSNHERLMAENPQYAELYRAQVSEKDENILSSEKKIILTAHRNMRILNRQRKEAEIAGIHQGDRVKILGRGDGNHDCK